MELLRDPRATALYKYVIIWDIFSMHFQIHHLRYAAHIRTSFFFVVIGRQSSCRAWTFIRSCTHGRNAADAASSAKAFLFCVHTPEKNQNGRTKKFHGQQKDSNCLCENARDHDQCYKHTRTLCRHFHPSCCHLRSRRFERWDVNPPDRPS